MKWLKLPLKYRVGGGEEGSYQQARSSVTHQEQLFTRLPFFVTLPQFLRQVLWQAGGANPSQQLLGLLCVTPTSHPSRAYRAQAGVIISFTLSSSIS